MELAISVFLNGIFGVFTGMAVLYVAIRLMALISERRPREPEPGGE